MRASRKGPVGRRDFLGGIVKTKPSGQMSMRKDAHGDSVSLLGYGMMRLPTVDGANSNQGGSSEAIDVDEVFAQVDYAQVHGVNYFDTSPGYCRGE